MQLSPFLLRGLYAYLCEAGLRDAFLEEAGLRPELWQSGRAWLDLGDVLRAGRAAQLVTNDCAVALHAGYDASLRTLGPLGCLLLQQSTLRDAFAALERYLPLLSTRGGLWLRDAGSSASVVLDLDLPDAAGRRFLSEYLLAFLLRFLREFHGRACAQELKLPYPRPIHAGQYERVFGCTLRFEAPRAELQLSSGLLDRPQLLADVRVARLLTDELDAALEREVSGAPVHQRIASLLKTDPSLWDAGPSALAKLVGLSPRSMRRRLTCEGKSLSALIEDARMDRACYLLRETDVAIKCIAERLGYSEPSAFHRAFKRWTGQTPGSFKRDRQPLAAAC